VTTDQPLALIIEDDPQQADIFSQALNMAGYSPKIITDGASALEALAETAPALIVLDLHLPGLTGDKILQHIRNESRLRDTPVILATADPRMAETLHEESDLVLLKPVSFFQLRELAARLGGQNSTS